MAGAVTHLLVVDESLGRLAEVLPELLEKVQLARPFALLGAVSPDLPYLDVVSQGQSTWADRMHYRFTNQLVLQGAIDIGGRNLVGTARGNAELGWLMGFAAHCVTDATIHPIVQAIVGPYHANPEEHRRCEMTQDSLLYSAVKGCELCGSEYVEVLKQCEPKGIRDNVLNLWTWPLKAIYPDLRPRPKPRSWFSRYSSLLDTAADCDLVVKLCRGLPGAESYLYSSAATICLDRPEEARRYFDEVPLPNQRGTGRFQDVGFKRAVENVVEVWSALWADVQNAEAIGEDIGRGSLVKVLRNWDLDTGADMDIPDPRVSYWPVADPQ